MAAGADSEGGVKGMVLNVAERDEVVDGEIVYGLTESTAGFKAFIDAVSTFGDLHGIINAGIIRDGMMAKKDRKIGGVKVMSNNKWRQVIDVNLTGVFLGSSPCRGYIANGKERRRHHLRFLYLKEWESRSDQLFRSKSGFGRHDGFVGW